MRINLGRGGILASIVIFLIISLISAHQKAVFAGCAFSNSVSVICDFNLAPGGCGCGADGSSGECSGSAPCQPGDPVDVQFCSGCDSQQAGLDCACGTKGGPAPPPACLTGICGGGCSAGGSSPCSDFSGDSNQCGNHAGCDYDATNGTCSGSWCPWPCSGLGSAWDCANFGCGPWTPTCCDPNNPGSPTYVSGGYCSAACNGTCSYDAGSGNWQSASCSPGPCCNPNVIVSCGAWSKCSPSCGAGTQSEICTDQCGGQHTFTQSCYTTYFQTFGGDVTARKGLSDACLPSGKYILGN